VAVAGTAATRRKRQASKEAVAAGSTTRHSCRCKSPRSSLPFHEGRETGAAFGD